MYYHFPLLIISFILAFHCFTLTETPFQLTGPLLYAKAPYPITRGYLKSLNGSDEKKVKVKPRRGEKLVPNCLNKKLAMKKIGRERIVKREKVDETECKFICSLCHRKHYKYRRNKLRHEKYECVTGPQFACTECDKRYSQKKTLTAHRAVKHGGLVTSFKTED